MIVGLLAVTVSARGDERAEVYFGHGQIDGKWYESKASPEAIKHTPVWQPQAEHPPLGPGRARELATKQLQSILPDADKWWVFSIELLHYGEQLHWWYYRVHFQPQTPEDVAVISGNFIDIVVFMDGTVLKPQRQATP